MASAAAVAVASLAMGAMQMAAQKSAADQQAAAAEYQGQVNSNLADYQAQVAQNNSKIAANNAQIQQENVNLVSEAGNQQSANEGLKTKATVGGILSAQGANGVDVNSGSAVDVRSSASELGMLNALTVRSNAAQVAYGYEIGTQQQQYNSQQYLGEASLDTAEAGYAREAGAIGASSAELQGDVSLLGSASSLGGNYLKYRQYF